jgi:membrane protease YdiL (CAAX protease family)
LSEAVVLPLSPFVDVPAHLVCTGQLAAPDAAALARLLLLAPVLEEWVVRAGLQEWLIRRRLPHGGALPVALSAIAFALLHLGSGMHAVLLVLAPGVAMGVLYQRTRDWRLCALLHCGMNALALGGCALATSRGFS